MNGEEIAPETAAALKNLLNSIASVVGTETVNAAQAPGKEVEASVERAMARLEHREACRQANIEQILRFALQELAVSNEKVTVEGSWLVHFFDCGLDAGHEEEQRVWARILAREIAAAGSFGKRTLAFLRTMERWELEGFIEYAAFAFAFESGWRFMFDEEIARREIWTYGRELDLMQHFIEIGLLAKAAGRINPASGRGLRIRYRDHTYELRGVEASSDKPAPREVGVAYRKFTVIGQQLFDAIRPKSFFGYARNLVKALSSEHGTRFEPIEPTPG